MKWFDYLKKTPVKQIVADWKEYGKLQQQLEQAEYDVYMAYSDLFVCYGIDKKNNMGRTCLKRKMIVKSLNFLDQSPCRFLVENCAHFMANGYERKCCESVCAMKDKNNHYYDMKSKCEALKNKYETFWTNKFAHVK